MNKAIFELIKGILPSVITAVVSILALVINYKSTRYSIKQNSIINSKNMNFTQKEKLADQIVEKSSLLLTNCDPNRLNTIINGIVPKPISHEENATIRKQLLTISDDIQTLANIIKLLNYSIISQDNIKSFERLSNTLDNVVMQCNAMLLKLTKLYSAMTPEGALMNLNIMEEKMRLEREFSDEYPPSYIDLHICISEIVQKTRFQAMQ